MVHSVVERLVMFHQTICEGFGGFGICGGEVTGVAQVSVKANLVPTLGV